MGKIVNVTPKHYIENGITHAVVHSKSTIDGIQRMLGFHQVGVLPYELFNIDENLDLGQDERKGLGMNCL